MTLVVTRHDRTAPPVKNPLPADAGDVMIFQNYYQDGQERSIDPAFVPRDGRHNANTHYREVALFARMYRASISGPRTPESFPQNFGTRRGWPEVILSAS